MPQLRPFRGIRYASSDDLADKVCPPYDIVSPDDVEGLVARHPHNAVRLEVAAGAAAGRYDQVARTFESWRTEGVLRAEDSPSFYVYRQDFEDDAGKRRSVTGVIGDLRLEPLGQGVLPHEQTMAGPKKDRLALLRACPVNFSPIYGIFHGRGAVRGFYDTLAGRPPQARVADDSGILHRLWVVAAAAEVELLSEVLADVPLVIADGHHRYETALAFRDEQGDRPGGHDGIMCFCVDADAEDLIVLPYHRVVRAGVPEELETRLVDLGARLDSQAAGDPEPDFRFVTARGTWHLIARGADEGTPQLPVTVLHEEIFPRLFPQGVEEMRFTKDPEEVRALVAQGEFTAGVLLKPVDAATVVDVAAAGRRMPQKASYFWPKAVTGLVFRSLR